MRFRGIFFTIASAVLFGITPVLARLTYDLGANALTVTFFRNLMAIPLLFCILLITKQPIRLPVKKVAQLFPIGAIGIGCTTLMLYASYISIGVSTATTLHFLYPVFVALICRVFYKEHLSAAKVWALAAASVGILLFFERSQPGQEGIYTGLLLAILSGVTYAYYMSSVEKKGFIHIPACQLSLYLTCCVAVTMLLVHLVTGQIHLALPAKAYAYMLALSFCTSFLAIAFLQIGIKYLNATTAAIFSLFEPITSNVAGIVFLGESLSIRKIFGSLVILGGVLILVLLDRDKSQKSISLGE